ncbi:MAG TPA: antibiotic biosynthesis monooxygenase [Holosporales bacterium]|nr:antibiotic biosynthesis monooxygenase [Holosporales bacterium]
MSIPHTVVVILEAKQGKEQELELALEAVVEPSSSEEACLEYRLHKSVDNPAQFVLYENWASKEEHQAQFDKPYIKDLGAKLGELLASPYQAVFAQKIISNA